MKAGLLQWAQQFDEVVWLDSNNYEQKFSSYEAVLAVEAFTAIKSDSAGAFERLREYQSTTGDWIFGTLSYDLKNDVEQLTSENFDGIHFPDLYFFQPKKLFLLKGDELEMQYLNFVEDEMEDDLEEIFQLKFPEDVFTTAIEMQPRIPKEEYLRIIRKLLQHIQKGDIYEANFCQEFYAEVAKIDPLQVYNRLNEISVPPFAAFVRLHEHFLLSASPERYLRKENQKLISQPIKGTARRSKDPSEDSRLFSTLQNDQKERSENVMIVDLVRNDLSKVAKKATVKVEELCKVYSFQQVHQMISTVTAELEEGIPPVEALKSSFPMGSMTGAPKISAMEIIEKLEETKRGIYSGAVGYVDPVGNFDFNVVIRSIIYNQKNSYVSFSVGGAITTGSVPEKEYDECLVKARALQQALGRAY